MVEHGGGRPQYTADARRHEGQVSKPVSNRSRNREDYYRVGNVPVYRELDAEVVERKAAGDETARKEFAEGNLRLVLAVARGYQRLGVAFQELVSVGNEALMRAVDGFDPQKGKFSTYAGSAIEKEISHAVMKRRHPIYIPPDKLSELDKFRRIQAIKRKDNGREPTDAEVAEKMDIEVSKIQELRWLAGLEFVSMEQPVDSDEPAEITRESPKPALHETLPSPHPGVEEEVFSRKQREVIMERLATLAPKERELLVLRFGLEGGEPMTHKEIAQVFGVPRNRVGQIEAVALRKLRHPSRSKKLIDYLS